MEQHNPTEIPNLGQHYKAQIMAVLEDPATVIETRMMPAAVNGEEHEWVPLDFGTDPLRTMLHLGNYKDGYEYRVQPKGHHVWIAVGSRKYGRGEGPKLGYAYECESDALTDTSVFDHIGYLHIEFDPEDRTKMRVCEIKKVEESSKGD